MSREGESPQIDFSGGQINLAARRREDLPAVKTGGRTALNWRCNNTGQLQPRPGRRALFPSVSARNEYIRVSTGQEFQVAFPPGGIAIYSMSGALVASYYSYNCAWGANPNLISWAMATDALYICFPSMQPLVAQWDRGSLSWSFAPFAFAQSDGAINQPYYRLSVPGATMSYSAVSGSVTLTCSENFFTAAMVGSTISVVGQQAVINAVASPTSATVTPSYQFNTWIAIPVTDVGPFQVGQIVQTTTQNIKFEVGYIDTSGKKIHGVFMTNIVFDASQYNSSDTLVSPVGSSPLTGAPSAGNTNLPSVQWQQEFMSAVAGWPSGVAFNRGRVIFYGFPQARNAILWGAVGSAGASNQFWVDSVAAELQPAAGAAADAAILELMDGTPTVKFVVGWQQGQFVFTDRGVWFIAISNTSPLTPSSVDFNQISNDGVGLARPIPIEDMIVFMNAGLNRCSAVRATGSYTRPFIVDDVSDPHTDLFASPFQIAVASGDGQHPERYVYVVNSDGSTVIGKLSADRQFIGWAPATSQGLTTWVTTAGPNVYFTTNYASLAGGVATNIVELEDDTLYLDCNMVVNSPAVGLTPAPGYGPLWLFAAGTTVTLMDGARDRGDRQIDVFGNIIAIQGEDLTSPTLMAGFFSICWFQPIFRPSPEVDRGKKAVIRRIVINVEQATDFTLGTRIFPVEQWGADATQQPVLMDGIFRVRAFGRAADPTFDFIKHRPGPLTLCELSLKASN